MSGDRKEGISACLVSPAQATYATAILNGALVAPVDKDEGAPHVAFTVAPGMLVFHGEPIDAKASGDRSEKRRKMVQTAVGVVAHMGETNHPQLTLYGVATRQIEDGRLARHNLQSVGALSVVTSGAITIYAECPEARPGDELFVAAEQTNVKYLGISDAFKFPTFRARRSVKWTSALADADVATVTTAGAFGEYNSAVGSNGHKRIAAHVAAHHGAAHGGVLEPGAAAFVGRLHPDIDGTAGAPYAALLKDIKARNVGAYSMYAHRLGTLSDPEHDIAAVEGTGVQMSAADKASVDNAAGNRGGGGPGSGRQDIG